MPQRYWSTSGIEMNCCLSVTHLRNLIDNLHLCQYPQVKQRMRRDTQLDGDTNADEEEEEDGTNFCSAFEINQHLLCHTDLCYTTYA